MRRIVFAGRPEGVVRRFLGRIDMCNAEELFRRDPATIDQIVLWGDFIDSQDPGTALARLRLLRERTVISFESAGSLRVARLEPWFRAAVRFVRPEELPRLLFGPRARALPPSVPRAAWAPVPVEPGSEAEECILALERANSFQVASWRAEYGVPERTFQRHCKLLLGAPPKRIAERRQAAVAHAAWNGGASAAECAEFAQLSDEGSLRKFLARVGRPLPRRPKDDERRATSDERRATSDERRATSDERRATSDELK